MNDKSKSIKDEVLRRYAAGESIMALGREFGKDPSSFYRWIHAAGIHVHNKVVRKRFTESHKQAAAIEYLNGAEVSAVMKKYDCSLGTLQKWTKAYRDANSGLYVYQNAEEKRYNDVTKRKNTDNNKGLSAKDAEIQRLQYELKKATERADYAELKLRSREILIEIAREEFGIDLLKKDGAKQ